MKTPKPNSSRLDPPSPDDLAGIPVSKEEGNNATRPREGRGAKVRGRGRKSTGNSPPPPLPQGPPTADDLAGIPISAEGEEHLTARPRKPGMRKR